jgi:hypothetical protein
VSLCASTRPDLRSPPWERERASPRSRQRPPPADARGADPEPFARLPMAYTKSLRARLGVGFRISLKDDSRWRTGKVRHANSASGRF